MAFSSQSLLQFDELTSLIASYAGSTAGRALVETLEPQNDRFRLEAALAETNEAIAYLREASAPQESSRGAAIRLRFGELRDVESAVRILRVEGASLDGPQILDLFHTLALAGEYRSILLAVAARYMRLAARARNLTDLRDITKRYARVFLPSGELADDASPVLRHIRRDIERQQRSIQESLERFIRAHRTDGTLQEDFVTIREDRYVVPIVAGQKGRVDGVIHGSSGTGRTLFVEPLETITLNNQLVRLREDELREIERILAEITDALRAHASEIAATAEILAALDCTFAKASFALAYDATIPRFSTGTRRLILRGARHPLLETVLRKQKKRIVPISFELTEGERCLLISGPNTGGKTVTLKTTGLLAVMAHAALPVPASEAEFPLLDDVLADIGDAQSIEESLSSFSGHLLHVKDMLARVTSDCLVLLDELGRATDPEEGGALGVGILDEFRKSGAFCLASTHLLPLKLYGAQTEGVLNGSMGFDDTTLQPTYELRLGLPGKSAGIDIATRLQMPEPVLALAREAMPRMQADFQELLANLHHQKEENAQRARELAQAAEDLRNREARLESEAVRREERRRRDWEQNSERLIADFEARAQMAIQQLAESAEHRKPAETAQRAIARTKREFREQAAEAILPPASTTQTLALEEGVKVRLKDVREPAIVRRVLKNGMIEVEAGFLKMQVPREDIAEVMATAAATRNRPANIRVEIGPQLHESYRELNLIGQRAEEAVDNLDKFLDSAALASVTRIRIIHGHGMGILKRAVSDFLSSNPHVSRFYPAPQEEGGSGATIVELRE